MSADQARSHVRKQERRSAIGGTPLVELGRVTRGLPGRVLAKLEYLNPGGSKMDRIALRMIEDAEAIDGARRLAREERIFGPVAPASWRLSGSCASAMRARRSAP